MSPDPEPTKKPRFARYKDLGEFVFAAVLTVYGVFGYYVIRDQLNVMEQQTALMKAQLADARNAAADSDKITARTLAALEKQADASKTLADTNQTMAESASLSAKNSERMAKASEQGIVNAGLAMKLTQEIARSEQRAFLVVVGEDVIPVMGEVYKPTVRIVNDGKSVARNVVGRQSIVVVATSKGPPFDKVTDAEIITGGGYQNRTVALQPGGVFVVGGATIPNADGLMDKNGELLPLIADAPFTYVYTQLHNIVVWGDVTFTDVFDERRQLPFCYRVMWSGGGVTYYPCDE